MTETAQLFEIDDENPLTAEQKQNIAEIIKAGNHLLDLINEVLNLSKIEAGQLSVSLENIKLDPVVTECMALTSSLAENNHISMRNSISPDRQLHVHADFTRLKQVLLNLISNATDAMEGQADPQIWVDISRNGAVYLRVRDNGPGLEDKDKIFEPFYTTKPVGDGDGMGLGLSISYGIVQSFGGQIVGENYVNGGAVFRIELTPAEAV